MAQQGYPPQYNTGQQHNYPMPPPQQNPARPGYDHEPPGGGPGGGGWMNMPKSPPNCPPGLEYLTMIDQMTVHQTVANLLLNGSRNKFTIKNSIGQNVYNAVEDSECLSRICFGSSRVFDIEIRDKYLHPVMYLSHPMACNCCCFPCGLQSIEVSAPPGYLIGTVQQEWRFFKPSFVIIDPAGNVVFRIKGPFCTTHCCGNIEFKVMSADGEHQVGRIFKQWSGLIREMCTDSYYIEVTFPMDLEVKSKAGILGACFLIEAMYLSKFGL